MIQDGPKNMVQKSREFSEQKRINPKSGSDQMAGEGIDCKGGNR